MLLFHAVSTYQLLLLIEYKIKYHMMDKVVFLIPYVLIQKFPQYDNLRNYFEDILLYDAGTPQYRNKSVEEGVREYFEMIFKTKKYNILDFSEIYVGCAHGYFGIYLASNDIPFIFFEDAAGMLSRPDILIGIDERAPIRRSYNIKYGLYDGTCPCIKKIVCNKKAQSIEFDQVEHFDVVEELLRLPEKDREWIKKFFTDVEVFDIKKNAVLFLTQHFANLQVLSFAQQVLVYQTVFDYFFEGKDIVIKPHPSDIMYYGKLFPQYKIIREVFPSEFLPIMFTNKPDMIATISSTAINNLFPYFSKCFCLGTQYEKDFVYTHKYYVAVQIMEKAGFSIDQKCEIGTNNEMVQALLHIELEKGYFGNSDFKNGKCYLVDDIEKQGEYTRESVVQMIEQMEEGNMMIFINSKMDYCFYDLFHKSLWDHIVPVCINKRKIRDEDIYSDVNQEIVYVYSKSEEIRHMIENYEMNKGLKNSGIDIEIQSLSPEERRIKVLEGLLEATEKRLLHYIQIVEKDKTV